MNDSTMTLTGYSIGLANISPDQVRASSLLHDPIFHHHMPWRCDIARFHSRTSTYVLPSEMNATRTLTKFRGMNLIRLRFIFALLPF